MSTIYETNVHNDKTKLSSFAQNTVNSVSERLVLLNLNNTDDNMNIIPKENDNVDFRYYIGTHIF